MPIQQKFPGHLRDCDTTDEVLFFNRRQILKSLGMGTASITGLALSSINDPLLSAPLMGAAGTLYPANRNERYSDPRPLTDEKLASTYNNFYEFGSSKTIAKRAQALKIRPWEIRIDGEVDKERTFDFDGLVKKMNLEERIYRFRCVERWAMIVPWTGFPLAELVKLANPTSKARYLRFETFLDPKIAPGQKQYWYPWPYVEGVTMAEAMNDLSFLVTGVYGKALPNQFGAPIRLALPWKYGFKSIKSIRRISFTEKRPVSFWETIQGREYGFWANVNPEVPHPRWSQAREKLLGSEEEIPTRLFNGYGDQVADLYKELKGEVLFR